MKRIIEIFRILFSRAFWRDFTDLDMQEESRMMHDAD